MVQLGYSSALTTTAIPKLQRVRQILEVSRENNVRGDLTGFLLIEGSTCFQILEGPRDNLFKRFHRIEADGRHRILKNLGSREIIARDFPAWSMGSIFRDPSHQGIFLNHGFDKKIDPLKITFAAFLALAIDLQAYELSRLT